jgi:hypothetical protein
MKVKKQTNNVTRDQIIDYLDNKFWEEKQYECMPENEIGYEFVPREALEKIVDGLIPMIKNMIKGHVILGLKPVEIPEISDVIIKKQDELIKLLDDCNFSTMVSKEEWLKRKELYDELAELKERLK